MSKDEARCEWLREHAGILMGAWAELGLWPEWWRGEDMRIVIDAAMESEMSRGGR
jgi:hypothetical protein